MPMSDSIAIPVGVKGWAGEYFWGGVGNTSAGIHLMPDGTYEARFESVYNSLGSVSGTWLIAPEGIVFIQKESDGEFVIDLDKAFQVARHDGVLLVPVQWREEFQTHGATSNTCFRRGEAYPDNAEHQGS